MTLLLVVRRDEIICKLHTVCNSGSMNASNSYWLEEKVSGKDGCIIGVKIFIANTISYIITERSFECMHMHRRRCISHLVVSM